MQSVNGYIKRDDWAYSVYFATLQTAHDELRVGLTVSVGKWWDDTEAAVKKREWVYMMIWPSESGTGFEIRIEEPGESRHSEWKPLGMPVGCDAAIKREQLDDFFEVAKFVIDEDPAVLSYLSGMSVNVVGRTCVH
jgi:hypothetical protein